MLAITLCRFLTRKLARTMVALVGRRNPGLALKPLLQVRVCGDMLGQYLDGDGAIEAGVGGLVVQ